MIQRIQSLYLLLAAAAGAATWFFDLWKAKLADNSLISLNPQSNFWITALYVLIVLLAVVCIFLYRNRRLQFRLTVVNILLAIGVTALQLMYVQTFRDQLQAQGKAVTAAYYQTDAFLPIVIVILLFLAAKGIYKDEKLIKSLDRLR